jgi:hypothetical protein
MDFITLATETNPRRLLRYLTDVTGDDDDMGYFPKPAPAATAATAAAVQETSYDMADRPVFSKTAEAELYLLATNFLLYVSLVIITILVAKIYFPQALERSSPVQQPRARSYSYRMAAAQASEEYYGSDAEGEDDGDGDNDEEILDSGDEEEEDLLLLPGGGQKASSVSGRINSLLEFQQESLSKAQVLKRLVFCSIMLNVVFVLWGALQVCINAYMCKTASGWFSLYNGILTLVF